MANIVHNNDEGRLFTDKLTKQELFICETLSSGFDEHLVASRLNCSPHDIKKRMNLICLKLGVRDRDTLEKYWKSEIFQVGLRELGYL